MEMQCTVRIKYSALLLAIDQILSCQIEITCFHWHSLIYLELACLSICIKCFTQGFYSIIIVSLGIYLPIQGMSSPPLARLGFYILSAGNPWGWPGSSTPFTKPQHYGLKEVYQYKMCMVWYCSQVESFPVPIVPIAFSVAIFLAWEEEGL